MANSKEATILQIVEAALNALRCHEEEVNLLNVYPVPDGDTGSNMVHTMESVYEGLLVLKETDKGAAYKTMIEASLMGGRGNSGVILSQIIKGFCEVLADSEHLDSALISRALENSSKVAFKAIKKPAEGTILTVIKDMAKASRNHKGDDINSFLDFIIEAGRRSVARGPELLPVLKEAGVVDAGGWGLLVMASAVSSFVKGETEHEELIGRRLPKSTAIETSLTFTYCTELIVESEGLDASELEDVLAGLGDSLLVVGREGLAHVHIHTDCPGDVLNIATSAGTLLEVKINNMASEVKDRADLHGPEAGEIGIVAISSGEGIKKILMSLGALCVISGGQTMNVSVKDILAAAKDLNNSAIIILPGNKNIILAAERAADMCEKEAGVVPTKSAIESFSALLSFDPNLSLKENLAMMTDSILDVRTGELTRAVREAKTTACLVKKGNFLGLIDQEISVVGSSFLKTALALIDEMVDEDSESMIILFGQDIKEKERKVLIREASKRYKSL
ncbi:MAG: DAK2 domain-containing protein [Actinomycetota bacterium]|nr:DAK2 domain-containing protein [Actinomycetota bacterium]